MTEPVAAPLVVIVEDDPAIAEGLALNLKLQGYRTDVAGDGEAAVPLVDSVRPDLVLLDISLPKQSGIWVLETLRGVGNLVPVIGVPPQAAAQAVRFGDVAIDLSARTVTRAGHPVKLTHLEFELLSFFCRNEKRVFSREELLREVWGLRQANPARTVDNFVAQLRAKVEADPERPTHLLTVRGSGYRFVR